MTRADLEAAAAEKYPPWVFDPSDERGGDDFDMNADERAAYIRGRLDQAEADAQIAEADTLWEGTSIINERQRIAAAIREGVE